MKDNEIFQNPRVIIVQKLYSYYLNKDSELYFPKHRYKKFIKDVVNGTIERRELIENFIVKELKDDINENKTALIIKLMIMGIVIMVNVDNNDDDNNRNDIAIAYNTTTVNVPSTVE